MNSEGKGLSGGSRFVWERERRWITWALAALAGVLCTVAGVLGVDATTKSGDTSTLASFALLGGPPLTIVALCLVLAGLSWRWKGWPAEQAAIRRHRDDVERQWAGARALYRHLSNGTPLSPQPCGPVVLRPEEQVHVQAPVGYARYVSAGDGSYVHTVAVGTGAIGVGMAVGSMIGNARRRSAAADAAAQKWREHQQVHVMASGYGLIAFVRGQVMHFDWSTVTAFHPEPLSGRVVFEFRNSQPLMLHGPAAPLFTVYAAHRLLGPQQFATGYELAALR